MYLTTDIVTGDYVNWNYLEHLLTIKLYLERESLSRYAYEFYEELFERIENNESLPFLLDYIEHKSKAQFKHVSYYWQELGDVMESRYDFSIEAIDFINYEYFLDPKVNTANSIADFSDWSEMMTDQLHDSHVNNRNEDFSYGDDIEYGTPYIMYVGLITIINDLQNIDYMLTRNIFKYKRIKTFYKYFEHRYEIQQSNMKLLQLLY